jgi:hypothetical protein
VRGPGGISWPDFFARVDVQDPVAARLACQSASNFAPNLECPLRSSFVHRFGKRLQSCVAGSIPLIDWASIPSSRPTSVCTSRAGAVQDDV